MYDSAAVQTANDRLWCAIADRLRASGVSDVPTKLDRSRPLEAIWADPDLLLAQTCGYPLVTSLHGKVRYLATPQYRAPGCDGATHRSRIVVRRDDDSINIAAFRGRVAAVNDPSSNSGANLFRALVAPLASNGGFFEKVIATGSHAASASLVSSGAADIAAIDAVSFTHLRAENPEIFDNLRTLTWSASVPCLPFVTAITASNRLVKMLRDAISEAILDARREADLLLLEKIEVLDIRRYAVIRSLEHRAQRVGYPVLA